MRPRTALGAAGLALLIACGGGDSVPFTLPAKIGARVVYVADTNGSADWWFGDEIWVADTASATMEVTEISHGTDGRVLGKALVSPEGDYLGAFVGSVSPGSEDCPGGYQLLDASSGTRFDLLKAPNCAPELVFSPDGGAVVVRFLLDGGTGWNLALGTVPGFKDTLYQVGHARSSSPNGSQRFSDDSGTLVWVEDGGLYSTSAMAFTLDGSLRSTDTPYGFEVTPDGSKAVYAWTGGIVRVTDVQPLTPQSSTDLTTPLAGGSWVEAVTLSPDGSRALYVTMVGGVGGVPELWLVNVAIPHSEQRVDVSAPIYKFVWYDIPVLAWNTDGTSFAWLGKVGAGTPQLYAASVTSPTTAVQLTPASEGVPASALWTDATTVVYRNKTGGITYELRSVSNTAPLTTVALSPPGLPASGVASKVLRCADGTVVYKVIDDTGSFIPEAVPDSTRLFSARPMMIGSYTQVTPTITAGPASQNSGIGDFACEP